MDLLGGWSADRLIQRGWDASKVRKAYLIAGLAFGMGIIGAGYSHTPTSALIWISISLGGLSAAAPVGWSVPSLISPKGSVGSVGGILNFSNQLSGIFAPVVTGYVVTITHSYAWAFWIAAAYLLIGISSYVFLLGRIEPFALPEQAV
jgi:MFS family permease